MPGGRPPCTAVPLILLRNRESPAADLHSAAFHGFLGACEEFRHGVGPVCGRRRSAPRPPCTTGEPDLGTAQHRSRLRTASAASATAASAGGPDPPLQALGRGPEATRRRGSLLRGRRTQSGARGRGICGRPVGRYGPLGAEDPPAQSSGGRAPQGSGGPGSRRLGRADARRYRGRSDRRRPALSAFQPGGSVQERSVRWWSRASATHSIAAPNSGAHSSRSWSGSNRRLS